MTDQLQDDKRGSRGGRRISPALPPLAQLCPDFAGFSGSGNKRQYLWDVLQHAARDLLGSPQRQRFYSEPEVARFFGVTKATAAFVFRRTGETVLAEAASLPRQEVAALASLQETE